MFVGFGRFGAFSGGVGFEFVLFAAVRGVSLVGYDLGRSCVWFGFLVSDFVCWYGISSAELLLLVGIVGWYGILGVEPAEVCVLMISGCSCLTDSRFLLV